MIASFVIISQACKQRHPIGNEWEIHDQEEVGIGKAFKDIFQSAHELFRSILALFLSRVPIDR